MTSYRLCSESVSQHYRCLRVERALEGVCGSGVMGSSNPGVGRLLETRVIGLDNTALMGGLQEMAQAPSAVLEKAIISPK